MKICHWTPVPNHYQRAFVRAMSEECDLKAVYFEKLPRERIALGWNAQPALGENEYQCDSLEQAFRAVPDWKERVHLVPGYGGPLQRTLARLLVRSRVDWVNWAESSNPGWKRWFRYPLKAWWTKLVNRYSLGSFAIGSRAESDFAKRGIRRSRVAFMPYVSEALESAQPDPEMIEFTRGRKTFLFLGALSHRKGVDILLRASAKALREAPDWTLVLVGSDDASAGKYSGMTEQFGLTNQVFFRGAVKPEHLGSILAASQVLVLPSRYDGWGVVINEALLSGRAIIASHMCGASEQLVIPGRNGFKFESGSVDQLTEVMITYVKNPGLAEQHGKESLSFISLIDPKTSARAMISTLESWHNSRFEVRTA